MIRVFLESNSHVSHLTILVQAQHFEIWGPPLYASVVDRSVLRAQEELAKSLKNGRGKKLGKTDKIFWGFLFVASTAQIDAASDGRHPFSVCPGIRG